MSEKKQIEALAKKIDRMAMKAFHDAGGHGRSDQWDNLSRPIRQAWRAIAAWHLNEKAKALKAKPF